MRNLIHFYGRWAECPIPTNCEVLYLKWRDTDYNRLSAIVYPTTNKPTLLQLVTYAIKQEKEEPVGVSYDYKLL